MAEYEVRRPLKRAPTHPGAILREDTLPALGLSVTEAARQLRVSRQMVHAILSERSSISPEMALRLGRFCGNGAAFWLRLQAAHDLWTAEQKLGSELRRIPEHSAA